jgi:hypothetical protein
MVDALWLSFCFPNHLLANYAVSAVLRVDTIFTSHISQKLRTCTSCFHQKVASFGFSFPDLDLDEKVIKEQLCTL